jgi:hypothetical protein
MLVEVANGRPENGFLLETSEFPSEYTSKYNRPDKDGKKGKEKTRHVKKEDVKEETRSIDFYVNVKKAD